MAIVMVSAAKLPDRNFSLNNIKEGTTIEWL